VTFVGYYLQRNSALVPLKICDLFLAQSIYYVNCCFIFLTKKLIVLAAC